MAAQPAGDNGAEFVWWHFEEQHRVQDGGVEAAFTLCAPDGLQIDELEFFYSIDSIRYRPPTEHAVQPENRRKAYRKAVPADTRSLTIYGGRYVQVELWAVAKTGGKTLVTQTAINLYGQSGQDTTDFEELSTPPPLPGFNMNRQGGFYAAQTGEPVGFSMRNGASGSVRIFLDGEQVTTLQPEDGVYHYVLPRDRRLTGRALLDHRDLLFVADETDGVQFTCCLPLYRSMRDNHHFPLGLTVLLSACAISLVAVIRKGRRFRWR